MYRVALEQDGHSSQQPFPQFDLVRFVDGLGDLLGLGGNTTAPTLTATGQSTDTGISHSIQTTTSAKQPASSAPIPTAGSVTYSPQAKPSTPVAHGMVDHEL